MLLLQVYVGVLTSDSRGVREVQWRFSMTKVAFSKEILSIKTLDYSFRRLKWCIWSTALYGAKSWILQKIDEKYPESFKMWCCWRLEIRLSDPVRNEELCRVKTERNSLHAIKRRQADWS